MRITQCYISQSVADFPFRETWNLTEYINPEAPCIFFGCYTQADVDLIKGHRGLAVIHWMGQDVLECVMHGWKYELNCYHVAFHPEMITILKTMFKVIEIKPWTICGDFYESKRGSKVYAYVPSGYPSYHKDSIVAILQSDLPHLDFIVSDGSIPQEIWLKEYANSTYDDCFIGLVLNNFAGGAFTIIQMGLKGRPVVTNVLDLPHTIKWNNIEDIRKAILTNHYQVDIKSELDYKGEFLNTENYQL